MNMLPSSESLNLSGATAIERRPLPVLSGIMPLVQNLDGRFLAIRSISPDGTLGRTVQIVDTATSDVVRELEHDDQVLDALVSSDGSRLVTGSMDGTLRVWDWHRGRSLHVHSGYPTTRGSSALSGNGRRVAKRDGTAIVVHDVESGLRVATLRDTSSTFQAERLTMTEDGRLLAGAGGASDPTIRVWDVENGQLLRHFEGHAGAIHVMRFSGDGRLATAGVDEAVRVWNLEAGSLEQTLTGHTDSVGGLEFSPDSRVLVSWGSDSRLRVWDLSAGTARSVHEWSWFPWLVQPVFRAGQIEVLTVSQRDNHFTRWQLAAGSPAPPSPRSGLSPTLLHTIQAHALQSPYDVGLHLAFSANGSMLVSGGRDGVINLWSVADGRLVRALPGDPSWPVVSIALSPDGQRVIGAFMARTEEPSRPAEIGVWDVLTGRRTGTLPARNWRISHLALSPDGRTLASGQIDGVILQSFHERGRERLLAIPVWLAVKSIGFSRDSRTVGVNAGDSLTGFWDVESGARRSSFEVDEAGEFFHAALSPDLDLLATSSEFRGGVVIWETSQGKRIQTLPAHTEEGATALCFSADGKILASGGFDEKIHLWDPRSGSSLSVIVHGFEDNIEALSLSPDGALLAAGATGVVKLWRLARRPDHPLAGGPK